MGSFSLSKGLPSPATVTGYITLGLGDLVNFRSFLCLVNFVYFPSITGLLPLSRGFNLEKSMRLEVCSGLQDCLAGSYGQVWKIESKEIQSVLDIPLVNGVLWDILHRLICLNTWSLSWKYCLERLWNL